MDKFLAPKGGKSSEGATPRADPGGKSTAAKALRKNSSLIRKLGRLPTPVGTTATTASTSSSSSAQQARKQQPAIIAQKKNSKPSYLEQLRGKKLGSKKPTGLSAVLRESLLAGTAAAAAKKRQLGNSLSGEEQQQPRQRRQRQDIIADENNVPNVASSTDAGIVAGRSAGSRLRTKTEKLKAKRPLAAAAAAAAKEAGWFDMPGVRGSGRDPNSGSGQQARSARAHQQQKQSSPAPEAGAEAHATATAASKKAAARGNAGGVSRQPAPERERVPPEPTEPMVVPPSRAGRMDEFFPRRVVTSSVRPLSLIPVQQQQQQQQQQPSSSSYRAGPSADEASDLARREEARRDSRDRSQDYRYNGEEGRGGDSSGDSRSGCGDCWDEWDHEKHLDPFRSADEEEEDISVPEFDGGVSRAPTDRTTPTASSFAGHTRPPPPPPPTTLAVAAAVGGGGEAVARSTARTEVAARAAAAAEMRAAAAAAKALPEARMMAPAVGTEIPETAQNEGIETAHEVAAAAVCATTTAGVTPAIGETQLLARGAAASAQAAVPPAPPATREEDGAEETAAAAAATSVAAAPWPCRRRRGAASLFLSQRQRTGGLRCRGAAVGDAGRDTFRRQAISTVLSGGFRTQRLRMGCTSSSRTGDGVVRGHPEAQGVHGRVVAGGVTCMEFDAVGWQLAVGGENVTVYDFDRYIPENNQLKHTLVSGVHAYLQPTDGIQTKRTVSCVRWNPANAEQLAVSYLNYDEVEVYDLRRIHPDRPATPVLTLLPSTGSAAVAAPAPAARSSGGGGGGASGGAFGRVRASGGGGGGGSSAGTGFVSSSSSSSLSGKFRGLGHLTLEFVRRGGGGVTHLVAGARGGVFRVWRFFPERAKQLAPYLQGQVTASHRGGSASRADVTAVCCLTPDLLLVGTESGQLATYSLTLPVVKNFRSSKNADQKKAWSLTASSTWGGKSPPISAATAPAGSCSIQFLRLSPEHGAGVVLCGLRNGRVVIFDTMGGGGEALGITEPHRGGVSVGFCGAPAAAPVPTPAAAEGLFSSNNDVEGEPEALASGTGTATAVPAAAAAAPLTEAEGARDPYSGGHWGPVVLACCKQPSSGRGEELVVLSTSARASLDTDQRRGGSDRGATRSPRKAGLRPGRGWEIGEAGGGGFRLEESDGYDLCLPVDVVEATPGRSRVRVSADVRGYLCSSGEERLLRTRLVTSSVMIGRERHSVEDVSADGTVLVLDRKYQGPAVVAVVGDESPEAGGGRDGNGGGGSTRAGSIFRSSSFSLSRDSGTGSSRSGGDDRGGQGTGDVDGSEVDEPEPVAGMNDDTAEEEEMRSSARGGAGSAESSAVQSSTGVPAAADESVLPDVRQSEVIANGGDGASPSVSAADGGEESATANASREQQLPPPQQWNGDKAWDPAWRPSNGVRLFAKLRAVFGDEQQLEQDYREEMVKTPGGIRRLGSEPGGVPPSYPLYQVVARAKLDLPVTAITSHPRMNFVLVGLSDGTVATVLPRGKRGKVADVADTL